VLVRGKALYEYNCASCHDTNLRGGEKGANLQRSGIALRDQQGELITFAMSKHEPPFNLAEADTQAISEYIHSVLATMGARGGPAGGNPNIPLNVLVGDPKAGEAQFGTLCSSCHSVTGNLKGFGAKYEDPRLLQNAWVNANVTSTSPGNGAGFQGTGPLGAGLAAVVAMPNGSKVEGTLVLQDDFIIVLKLADGTRRTITRVDGLPKVELKDPVAGHRNTVLKLAFEDTDSRIMHNITAYLATIK
jgi:mono/diheme cytochrome c family protein